jgi:hypothetical protein
MLIHGIMETAPGGSEQTICYERFSNRLLLSTMTFLQAQTLCEDVGGGLCTRTATAWLKIGFRLSL